MGVDIRREIHDRQQIETNIKAYENDYTVVDERLRWYGAKLWSSIPQDVVDNLLKRKYGNGDTLCHGCYRIFRNPNPKTRHKFCPSCKVTRKPKVRLCVCGRRVKGQAVFCLKCKLEKARLGMQAYRAKKAVSNA